MEDKFDIVCDVRKRSKRSWVNFKNAAALMLGQDAEFGTAKVQASSVSYLKMAVRESGLSIREIFEEIERRNLA